MDVVVDLVEVDSVFELIGLADCDGWDVVLLSEAADDGGSHWGDEATVAEHVGCWQENLGDLTDQKVG